MVQNALEIGENKSDRVGKMRVGMEDLSNEANENEWFILQQYTYERMSLLFPIVLAW